jgi:hypothetical protein
MESSNILHTGCHVLFTKTSATKQQIEEVLNKVISMLNVECTYRINYSYNRNGEYVGFAYVWVSNKIVYYAILNIDKPTITYTTRPMTDEEKEKRIFTPNSGSWADSVDDDIDDLETITVKVLTPNPRIAPYEFPLYELTEAQKQDARGHAHDNHGLILFEGFDHTVKYNNISHGRATNILSAKFVPHWVTAKMIKYHFEHLATDSTKACQLSCGEDTYPHVSFAKDGHNSLVYVEFDPNTNDGYEAIVMCKKVTVTDGNESADLYFDFAYEHDRYNKFMKAVIEPNDFKEVQSKSNNRGGHSRNNGYNNGNQRGGYPAKVPSPKGYPVPKVPNRVPSPKGHYRPNNRTPQNAAISRTPSPHSNGSSPNRSSSSSPNIEF